jgi:PAS domain-containing protein
VTADLVLPVDGPVDEDELRELLVAHLTGPEHRQTVLLALGLLDLLAQHRVVHGADRVSAVRGAEREYDDLMRPRPAVWGRPPGSDHVGAQRVALVACSNRKAACILPAGELYRGRTFEAAKAWAEEHADAWFILSALHMVVDPRRELEPYDAAWQHMDAETRRARVRGMATSVNNLVAHLTGWKHGDVTFGAGLELVVLAGGHYAEAVRAVTDRPDFAGAVHFPLTGLGIGQQYARLRAGGELVTPAPPPRPVESAPVELGDQLSLLEA